MERLTLSAVVRDASDKPDDLRAESRIPAVIYGGARKETTSLTLERSETLKLFKQRRSSSLIALDIAGEKVEALISEIQRDPVTGELNHIDFRQVENGVPVKSWVDLDFVGESYAVKTLGGMMMINRKRVHVMAPPEKLVEAIEIDLSTIRDFETSIHISDLVLPEGVELADEATASVVAVQKPKSKEEIAAEVAAEDAADAEAAAAAAPTVEGGEVKPAEGGDAEAEGEKSEKDAK